MANEATVTASLQINKGNLQYHSRPTTWRADVTGSKGPTPGAVTVPVTGVAIDFSELTTPGLCRVANTEGTGGNYVTYGIHDGSLFHPLGELLPGESFPLRLSRDLGEEHSDVGTGTTGTVNQLYFKANGGPVNVLVEAFEK